MEDCRCIGVPPTVQLCSQNRLIVVLPKVNETYLQRSVVLSGFFRHDTKGEHLVATSMSLSKATLTFSQLELNTWLDTVKNGPAEYGLTGDT